MKNLAVLVVGLLLVEGSLRLQQRTGPVFDLSPPDLTSTLSETRNHRHYVGAFEQNWLGNKYTKQYDLNGIRINSLRESEYQKNSKKRLLFLGDSFMEGFQDSLTLPQLLWERAGDRRNNWVFLNAGHSSYSPSIYTVQIRELEKLKPDFVVIAVDETDLGDDYLRYRRLVERDALGKIKAVHSTPETKIFLEGLESIKQNPFYLGRFFQKIYHTRVRMPKVYEEGVRPKSLAEILQYSSVSVVEAEKKYGDAIGYFKKVVAELVKSTIEVVPRPSDVLIVKHPHIGNVYGERSDLISIILEDECRKQGVAFIDVKSEMQTEFGQTPGGYFFPNDIHFNNAGFKVYAQTLAKELFPRISVEPSESQI